MRRLLACVLIVAVALGMLLSVASCTKTIYVEVTPTPQPMPTAPSWALYNGSSCYIVLDSSAGPIGTSLTVAAIAYARHSILIVTFDNERVITAPVVVEADGAGIAEFAILVPYVDYGTHRVDVTDGVNRGTQDFLVQTQLLPNPTFERTVIESFLNDEYVNAVLWEEWNLFDEWVYVMSLYAGGETSDFAKLRDHEEALANRAAQNLADMRGLFPRKLLAPGDLKGPWPKMVDALELMVDVVQGRITPFLRATVRETAPEKNAEAWLELQQVCREHSLEMEWPLPRVP